MQKFAAIAFLENSSFNHLLIVSHREKPAIELNYHGKTYNDSEHSDMAKPKIFLVYPIAPHKLNQADRVFVVTIPEFGDLVAMPCTEGKTYEEAIQSAQEVIETFLEIWQEKGEPIPQPQSLVTA